MKIYDDQSTEVYMQPFDSGEWIFYGTEIKNIFDNSDLNISRTDDNYNIEFIPNPTAGFFRINSDTPIKGFAIYDLLGKEMLNGIGQDVDISHLASGTYLVRVFLEGKIVNSLIVKG